MFITLLFYFENCQVYLGNPVYGSISFFHWTFAVIDASCKVWDYVCWNPRETAVNDACCKVWDLCWNRRESITTPVWRVTATRWSHQEIASSYTNKLRRLEIDFVGDTTVHKQAPTRTWDDLQLLSHTRPSSHIVWGQVPIRSTVNVPGIDVLHGQIWGLYAIKMRSEPVKAS